MSERDGYEPGVPCWVDTRQPGFKQPVPADVVATSMRSEGPPQWAVDFWVDDADATAARAVELGGAAIVAPFDMPIGRRAILADPRGATFSISRVVPG